MEVKMVIQIKSIGISQHFNLHRGLYTKRTVVINFISHLRHIN